MSCDCGSPGSGTPPDSTPSATSAPTGTTSAYGGLTRVLRGQCGPQRCPAPLASQEESADPYKPGWLQKLTTVPIGKLIVAVGDYLYLLRSKCSGYLFYDADSEEVSVQNPPFASAAPRETRFGFLGKAVPVPTQVCTDATDDCGVEIRQELAAQLMEEASCGDLVIARAPDCGELAPDEAGNADKQVRLDYLKPKELKATECPGDVRFLLKVPGKRGKVDCDQWIFQERVKMRKSQWGQIPASGTLYDGALVLVAVPVAGGDDENPCFELRMSQQRLVPATQPQQIFMLAPEHNLTLGVNTGLPRYAEMVAKGTKLWAIVSQRVFVSGNTSTGGTFGVMGNGIELGWMHLINGGGDATNETNGFIPLTEDKITLSIVFSGVGSPTYSSGRYKLRGFMIEP